MRAIILIIFAVWMLPACNSSNEATSPVLVVDLDAVAKATGRQELMQKELEFANLRLSEQLKLVASRLENVVSDEKEKIGEKPSQDEQQQFDAVLLEARKQLQNSKQLALQQANVFRTELILQFRQEVADISQQIAAEKKSQIVMVTNGEALWYDPAADITGEVIAVIRAQPSQTQPQELPTDRTDINQQQHSKLEQD